jgi:hypothetical protein
VAAMSFLSVAALAGLVLLYYLYCWIFRSNDLPKKESSQLSETKILSEQATVLQNLLSFPSSRARITISIENVSYV